MKNRGQIYLKNASEIVIFNRHCIFLKGAILPYIPPHKKIDCGANMTIVGCEKSAGPSSEMPDAAGKAAKFFKLRNEFHR